mmetsp:Transcript_39691/g.40453  ORF Transcript_39691/g.40453 Transcript_39691/m.40453 type:complete len:337 (-) Transcript_39691:320-1330(-)|eukprot:CAMPEP_0182419904 /NCGR_PEP_ID=MMETSP1167-20130531/4244_1 /TAXON_ID=2988 /ORGANISM="Mallomonas Sp, Strain CCMP3275" /LENGTH=336 /DNA_ID=CAMNT_0024595057 /DNA_START=69 /DNA_END=1079 /DNA_ORIENTATION=+
MEFAASSPNSENAKVIEKSMEDLKIELKSETDARHEAITNETQSIPNTVSMTTDAQLVKEFRNILSNDINSALTDNDCLRFLRARPGQITKSKQMVEAWWKWRNTPLKHKCGDGHVITPENILTCGFVETDEINLMPAEVERFFPHYMDGEDKDGRPIYWEKTGELSHFLFEAKKIFDVDDLVFMHIRTMEIMIQVRMHASSKRLGREIDKLVVVYDLKDISMRPDVFGFRAFSQFMSIDQNYYPERLHAMVMINAPWYFTSIWAVIRPWIDPNTVKKVRILGADFLSELRELIDDSVIPEELGGSRKGHCWCAPYPDSSDCSPSQVKTYLANQLS